MTSTSNFTAILSVPKPWESHEGVTYGEAFWTHIVQHFSHHTLLVWFTMFWSITG
jgi:hypothetical protein